MLKRVSIQSLLKATLVDLNRPKIKDNKTQKVKFSTEKFLYLSHFSKVLGVSFLKFLWYLIDTFLGWLYTEVGSADCGGDSIPYLFDQSADTNFVHFPSQRLGFWPLWRHPDAKIVKNQNQNIWSCSSTRSMLGRVSRIKSTTIYTLVLWGLFGGVLAPDF